MKIYSAYDRPANKPDKPGRRMHPVYAVKIDDHGHKTVYQTGEHDQYADIQASRPDEMRSILERALKGDQGALLAIQQRHGFYADVSNAPKTLAEMQQLILDATHDFELLPAEIREKFENNVNQFISEYGSPVFAQKMGWDTGETPAQTPAQTPAVTKEEGTKNEP